MKTKMGHGVPRAPSRDKEAQERQFILDVIINSPGPPRGLSRRRRGGGPGEWRRRCAGLTKMGACAVAEDLVDRGIALPVETRLPQGAPRPYA